MTWSTGISRYDVIVQVKAAELRLYLMSCFAESVKMKQLLSVLVALVLVLLCKGQDWTPPSFCNGQICPQFKVVEQNQVGVGEIHTLAQSLVGTFRKSVVLCTGFWGAFVCCHWVDHHQDPELCEQWSYGCTQKAEGILPDTERRRYVGIWDTQKWLMYL